MSGPDERNKAAPLDLEAIRRFAALARIRVDDAAESSRLQRELGAILGYVEVLRRIRDEEPAGDDPGGEVVSSGFRDDTVAPSLHREEVLRGAPDGDPAGGWVLVPGWRRSSRS